ETGLATGNGRRWMRERHRLIPHLKASGMEAIEITDSLHPIPHPICQLWPTVRGLEKVPPHMRPTKGQEQIVTVLGQAFVGTVPVTHQYHVDQVMVQLGKM